jgi:hypothetical protein
MTKINTREHLIEVQKGEIPRHSMVHKFGRNDAIPNGSWEFINLLGNTSWPLSEPTTIRIAVSGDPWDVVDGSGAREITVQGIDDSFNEVSETLDTSGAGISANSETLFWRVHRAWVSNVGVYGAANQADIDIEDSAGVSDLIRIGSGEGQSQFCAWTVPINKTAYFLGLHAHVDTNKTADIRVFSRENIDNTGANIASKRLKLYFDGVQGNMDYSPDGPDFVLPAKSDVWVEAYGDGQGSEVSCDFELLVVEKV